MKMEWSHRNGIAYRDGVFDYPVIDHPITVDDYLINDVKMTKELWTKVNPWIFKGIEIKNVIFNDPATIVFWTDGTKTVVKAQDDDAFDPEKGLAMAISKKALGNKGNYCNELKKWLPKEEPVSDAGLIIAKGLMAGLDAKPFDIKLPDLSGLKTAAENMNLLSKALKDEDYQEKPAKYDRETERKDIEANRMALCDHFVDFAMGKRGNIHEEYMKELKRSKVQKAYDILVACRDKCEGFDFDELIGYLSDALED